PAPPSAAPDVGGRTAPAGCAPTAPQASASAASTPRRRPTRLAITLARPSWRNTLPHPGTHAAAAGRASEDCTAFRKSRKELAGPRRATGPVRSEAPVVRRVVDADLVHGRP